MIDSLPLSLPPLISFCIPPALKAEAQSIAAQDPGSAPRVEKARAERPAFHRAHQRH
jgi:hypothetical protein